jgi:predicted phosphoserine aminotransferase
MRPFGRNFLPGPTDVRPEILEATLQPYYFGFAERMQQLIAGVQPGLQEMFGTSQPVFLSVSAATGLMEAAIRNGVRRRVLVVCGGYFGEMFARVAEGCGKEVIRAHVPLGKTLEPDQLEVFLEGPPVDAVALVHSESSTGALAPLAELARVVKRAPGRLLLVDGVTSVGAVPVKMDDWGVDFLFTGSQKALALPPGIAMGAVSPALLERAERLDDRGWYLSATHLVGAAKKHFPLTTPALPVFHALEAQMQRVAATGGLAARIERHARMAAMVYAWAPRQGLRVLADEGRRSPTVTALELPEGRDAAAIVRAMESRDWLIATGLAPLAQRVIRIGHMGDLEPPHLEGLLAELGAVLA